MMIRFFPRTCFILSLMLSFSMPIEAMAEHKKTSKKTGLKRKKTSTPKATETTTDHDTVPTVAATTSFKQFPITVGIKAKQVYMMDYETGAMLLEYNGTQPMYPASMTKIMTAYVVCEKLKEGSIKEDQEFIVSKNAYQIEGSKMFVELDKPVKVLDLLKGLIIQSGNDAGVVLAEGILGSEGAFSAEMTRRAQQLGATQTLFKNANGLPHPEHLTTAKDLAIISYHVIKDYPHYYSLYGEKSFTYNNITQGNRNPLLYKNIACDGIKTGSTDQSGFGMAASCKIGDRRVILVINGLKSMQQRADEATKLITWGLKSFTNKTFYKPTDVIGHVPVKHGIEKTLAGVAPAGVVITVPEFFEKEVVAKVVLDEEVTAPIQKGMKIGYVEVTGPCFEKPITVSVVAAQDMPKANWFICLIQDITSFFKGNPKEKSQAKPQQTPVTSTDASTQTPVVKS